MSIGSREETRRAKDRDRKRRERNRTRRGLGIFRVALDRAGVEDALVGRGLLALNAADDQVAVERAMAEAFRRYLLADVTRDTDES